MAKTVISEEHARILRQFLGQAKTPELVATYLYYIQEKYKLTPVLSIKDKKIYQSQADAIAQLEAAGQLWRETEIKITFDNQSVNENTKKIYICPFTGKVFGDNTHPNPQDAIYDWVAKCPENKERVGGLKVKRFFVSEDPEVIRNYLLKEKPKAPIAKVVFSSVVSGKLFNAKESVIEDFAQNYLKPLSLVEVQNQNRYQIETRLLDFIQKQLVEEKVAAFVEAMAEFEEFVPYVEKWIEAADAE